MKTFLIMALLLAGALCALGVDLSTLPSVDSLKCFRSEGRTFLIGRAWRSYASFDPNIVHTLSNALEAGFKENELGVYMFPCFNPEKAPEVQVEDMVKGLGSARYSSIWLDMETNTSPNCGWSKNFDDNCQFTAKLVDAALKSGKKVGIYASTYMWGQIMGGADRCTKFLHLPLWYAHYDGVTSFSDFKPFGGWTKPYAKQYKGTTALCNASVDLNYME